ncbi:MAG: type IX secretion system membrane protein PorP/SprF [Chitinophagia bacterium]|jgi:Type IX secretion system membrane protein PorP/SprF|nr:type IX secretion system membrane protein PorP/SprF [Chitinophagia bacterium]
MKNIVNKILGIIAVASTAMSSQAQDIHFSRVEDMSTIYNQSLKTSKDIRLQAVNRDVQFNSTSTYKTQIAIGDFTLLNKAKRTSDDNKGFFTATFAYVGDNGAAGVIKNTSAIVGIAYALPLNENGLYLAAGFQTGINSLNVNFDGKTVPEQYNQYGLIPDMPNNDPTNANNAPIRWVDLNSGLSLFKNGEKANWYLGASARHLNKPYTNISKTALYQLGVNYGVQAGYSLNLENKDVVGAYAFLNWQSKANDYTVGVKYQKSLGANSSLAVGVASRTGAAIIPRVDLRYNKIALGVSFESTTGKMKSDNMNRNATEVVLGFIL